MPSSVAFAADVRKIPVLKNAKSSAKKIPPIAMTKIVRPSVRDSLRLKNHVGAMSTVEISMR